jgi:poly [ADP-ribose] polymerase
MGRYTKLLMITAENNNKYYEMTEKSGIIDVKYGRVDLTSSSATYPLGQWDSIVASKVKKGYKDVTHLVSVKEDKTVKKEVTETTTLADIDDKVVANFLAAMKKYTDGLVSSTYTVKAVNVSRAQVDEAQKIINELNAIDFKNEKAFNTKLLELYTVIPRYMSHVTHHLLPNFDTKKGLQQEQDNLDAMSAQVSMLEDESKIVKVAVKTLKSGFDDEMKAKFITEAKILSALKHDHIVQ